jgi:hypothetical protein
MRGREPLAVWLLYAVVALEILVTYSRLPPSQLYHVSGSGLEGGASRVVVFLNFPVALAAIAVAALTRRHVLAAVGALLCLPIFWPGVVRQSDLDARWVNAPCVIGVVLVCAATAHLRVPSRRRGDGLRIAIAVLVVTVGLPWFAADLGFYFPGPHVHHGHHHGMDGVLLVLTTLLLSRLPSRPVARAYLALMFTYGFGNIANDFWGEQIVARGWTSWTVPSVLEPRLTWAWFVLVVAALGLWLLSLTRSRAAARTRLPSRAR